MEISNIVNMKDFSFLSSLALFKELYREKKGNIYNIIERFVFSAAKERGLTSFDKSTMAKILEEMYHIELPDAVIQRSLTNSSFFKYKAGDYLVLQEYQNDNSINSELEDNELFFNKIKQELIENVESKKLVSLKIEEKQRLIDTLYNYLLAKNDAQDDIDNNLQYIASYFVEKEADEDFMCKLSSIKEGLIIYNGIKYSSKDSDTSWLANTILFLDVEYLFSAYGYNGEIYQKYFFDFYQLVQEINDKSPSKNGIKKIRLYYLGKTKDVIEKFFHKAQLIKQNKDRLDPSNSAMKEIVNSCKDDYDVIRRKAEFYAKLKELGIELYNEGINVLEFPNYIFEQSKLIDDISRQENENTETTLDLLYIADVVSILRSGCNYGKIEKCGYAFLSNSNLSKRISKKIQEIYPECKLSPFRQLDVFTDLLWFKLKKGIVGGSVYASYNIINRSKVVVSSLLHEKISNSYNELLASNESDDILKGMYAQLRINEFKPDSINSDNIHDKMLFITMPESAVEKYKNEQSHLRETAKNFSILTADHERLTEVNRQLEAKVNFYKSQEKQRAKEKQKELKNQAKRRFSFEYFIYNHWAYILFLILFVIAIIMLVIHSTFSDIIAIISLFVTFVTGISWKKIDKWVKKTKRKRYSVYLYKASLDY